MKVEAILERLSEAWWDSDWVNGSQWNVFKHLCLLLLNNFLARSTQLLPVSHTHTYTHTPLTVRTVLTHVHLL